MAGGASGVAAETPVAPPFAIIRFNMNRCYFPGR
jgi:hypothetical protein